MLTLFIDLFEREITKFCAATFPLHIWYAAVSSLDPNLFNGLLLSIQHLHFSHFSLLSVLIT